MSAQEIFAARLAGSVLAPAQAGLVLAEWTADGATGPDPQYQAPLHEHTEDEAWYVLAGTLTVRAGDDDVEVPAGGAIVVPGGTPHTFWNPATVPARYLLVMGARTYGLIQALHTVDHGDADGTRALFERHGARLLE